MKVLINGRFALQPISGVQRYAHSTTKALRDLIGSQNIQTFAPSSSKRACTPVTYMWEQLLLPVSAASEGGDVLLSLCNWSPVIIHPQPSVVVLHDLMTLELPNAYSRSYRFARAAYHARLRRDPQTVIVAASRTTKLSLEDYFQREIGLAECGVSPPPAAELPAYRLLAAKMLGRMDRFVLLVGGHDPRKNADFAISLIPALAAMDLRLVVTIRKGATVFRSNCYEGLAGITVVEDPSDAVLWGLYTEANAVLHPSKSEGFGLPLLEAAAVGTPFISTDVGAARRLAVDDRQVLPLDAAVWEASIRYLTQGQPPIAARLREAANNYTWQRTAASLITACESAIVSYGLHKKTKRIFHWRLGN